MPSRGLLVHDGRQQGRLADLDDDRAVGELGELAGLE